MPRNIDGTAFSLAATAADACKAIRSTPLMTVAEGVATMRKAATHSYTPPREAAV
jgi:hypothetical protein